MIGTWRNIEKSGKRTVSKLSTIARTIEGVRHIDCDLIQYCFKCKKPQIFCEVERCLVNDREWEQMRIHARFWEHGAIALLVVEPDDGDIGVKIYDSFDGTISEMRWGGREYLTEVLETARDLHVCW